ncbi:MAG TPA: hypothetical protein VNA14_07975, partial [Mycobacteriales bacterium]|nr:hypothetical protein [Mycobacteriales bacterium]
MTGTVNRSLHAIAILLTAALMLLWLPLVSAEAVAPPYVDGVQVSVDLRGCDDPNLANCVADADFANGNLGKLFGELDRVAFRVFLTNGSPVDQVFHLRLAGDHEDGGFTGYDHQSVPVATGDCSITVLDRNAISPLGASGDLSISTVVEVTIATGASCAISYTQRLALGSSNFAGSNLQSRVLNGDYSSTGNQTLSIPVNQIEPQTISKTASTTATRGFDYTVGKLGTPAALPINTCLAQAAAANVSYTVSWTRTAQASQASTVSGVITLGNPSTRTLTGTVTDQILAGGVAVAGASAVFANQTVPALGTLAIPYSITVPAGTVGALTNSASAVYNDPDNPGTTLTALTTNVSVPAAVGVVVDGPSASAVITDTESFTSGSGAEFRRLTPTPAMAGFGTSDTFTETITSGTSGTIDITKIVRSTGPANGVTTLRNRVTITPGGGSASAPVDVTVPVTLTAANPTVTISKVLAASRPANTTFEFTITNNTTAATTQVSVTVPGGMTTGSSAATFVSPSANGYTVAEAPHPDFLPVAPAQVGALTLCGSGSALFSNVAATTSLGIVKSANPASGTTVAPGDSITYTLGYFNSGNSPVASAVISDPLPAGVTFVSASNGGIESGGVVTWPVVAVAANTTAAAPAGTRTVTVTVDSPLPDGTVLTNYGFINTVRSNPVTHTVSSAPVLSIVKSSVPASGTTVVPGSTITYSITYSNTGNDAAVGAIISDTLPTEVTYVSSSNGGTQTNGVVSWPAITIPAGATGTRTITVTVDTPLANGTVIVNTGWINAIQS